MIQVYVNRSEAQLFQATPQNLPHMIHHALSLSTAPGQDVWKPGIEDVGREWFH